MDIDELTYVINDLAVSARYCCYAVVECALTSLCNVSILGQITRSSAIWAFRVTCFILQMVCVCARD